MTRKARRLIFYAFIVVFVFLVCIIILYAQGYSFDRRNKVLVPTGALFLESYPEKADIYVDNKYKGQTNKFIKRLIPKEYNITISKQGYYDWQRTLKIKPKLVTEVENILLIKKTSLKTLVADNIKYLSISNNHEKILYLTNYPFSLHLLDIKSGDDNKIAPSLPNFNNLLNFYWSFDDKKVIFSFRENRYFVLDFENQLKVTNLNALIRNLSNYKIYNLEAPLFHPHNSDKLYFLSRNNLYSIKLQEAYKSTNPLSLFLSSIQTFVIYDNKILYIERPNGEFYKTDLEGSSFEYIFDVPFLESGSDIKIISDSVFLINNNFYFFNNETQVFKKIVENVKQIKLSTDKEKIFWKTDNEIGAIFEDFNEIIIQSSDKIEQAIWYPKTDEHIIFVENEKVRIAELNIQGKGNTTDIFIGKNPKVFSNQQGLYVLNESRLYFIKLTD